MTKLKLLLKEIQDRYLRENFDTLEKWGKEVKLAGFVFLDMEFEDAVTDQKYPHGFSGTPLDILVVHQTPGVTLSWDYDSFDGTNVVLSTDGACRIRAFVGRYTP